MSEEMAYMEILSVNHSEGTHYGVKDLTAEKLSKSLSKTHSQDLYHYPEKGDIIIIMIDDLEIANMSSGKILQLLNSANSMGIITHAICRCRRPSDAHHPPKPREEKEGSGKCTNSRT